MSDPITQQIEYNNCAFEPPQDGVWYRFTDNGEVVSATRKEGDFIIEIDMFTPGPAWSLEFNKHMPNRVSFIADEMHSDGILYKLDSMITLGHKPIADLEIEAMNIFNKYKDKMRIQFPELQEIGEDEDEENEEEDEEFDINKYLANFKNGEADKYLANLHDFVADDFADENLTPEEITKAEGAMVGFPGTILLDNTGPYGPEVDHIEYFKSEGAINFYLKDGTVMTVKFNPQVPFTQV